MLTEYSYHMALWIWGVSGALAALYVGWFWRRRVPPFWVVFLALSAAVIALLPAPASPEADTVAPAVLVAIFGSATGAGESVAHLWQRLGVGVAAAAVVALLLQVLWFRRWRRDAQVDAEGESA